MQYFTVLHLVMVDWKIKIGSSLPSNAVDSFKVMTYLRQPAVFAILTIYNVRQSNTQQYCCVATNEGGTTEQCASLIVN